MVALASWLGAIGLGCARDPVPDPPPISLVDRFADATVENGVAPVPAAAAVEWRFDGGGTVEPAADDPARSTGGWRALQGVSGLALREGRLTGTAGAMPMLVARAPVVLDAGDALGAIEIRMRASGGTHLSVSFFPGPELDDEAAIGQAAVSPRGDLSTDLRPGDAVETYILTPADSVFSPSFPFARIGHVIVRPTDAAGAGFALESVKLIGRSTQLAALPSGIGWHGLGDVYRETLVARAPERVLFDVELGRDPFLELSIGTLEDGPVTFRVAVEEEGASSSEVFARTVSTPRRWESARIALAAHAARTVRLSLALDALEPGALGFWGAPTLRTSGGGPLPSRSQPSPARAALPAAEPPQGVIVVLIDTLRSDHLEPWGHQRPTAPVLARLGAEGAVFRDAIAQGAWTKISVSSILTSLYPSTHGLVDMPDRLPASVTTLAEAHRRAGYATFATSSVPFTGKLTNLHQGVEVLYEATSIADAPDLFSKTARPFVDRLLPWLDEHRDVPFFVFLHVFDPHSPFEPYSPYERLWLDDRALAEHREHMKAVSEQIADPFFKMQALPKRRELAQSGVDEATYLEHSRAWYDASIRAMDVELGRVIERLAELGLEKRTVVALLADHGEEFLEHGRSFHGYSSYGEMINVPLILWWPGVVPAGTVVEETVETIDLFPTVLELAGLDVPPEAQGQSLLPLLAGARARELGWRSRPAFSERAYAPLAFTDDDDKLATLAIVADGWKLIRNVERPEGRAEFELYDHRADPLNLDDVAAEHGVVVERLAAQLEAWHREAVAARVKTETGEVSPEELERLRSLGYVR